MTEKKKERKKGRRKGGKEDCMALGRRREKQRSTHHSQPLKNPSTCIIQLELKKTFLCTLIPSSDASYTIWFWYGIYHLPVQSIPEHSFSIWLPDDWDCRTLRSFCYSDTKHVENPKASSVVPFTVIITSRMNLELFSIYTLEHESILCYSLYVASRACITL